MKTATTANHSVTSKMENFALFEKQGVAKIMMVEMPKIDPHGVIVKSIYGTFKHGTEKLFATSNIPSDNSREHNSCIKLGNAVVGSVYSVGSEVRNVKVEDRVLISGSMAKFHYVLEQSCRVLPPGVLWQSALCLNPLFCALGAVRDAKIGLGDTCVVFGLGALGQLTIACAKAQGASHIYAVDPNKVRQKTAELLGAQYICDPINAVQLIGAREKNGVDVCFDFSGSFKTFDQAFSLIKFGGNILLGSAYSNSVSGIYINLPQAHIKRPNLIFTRSASDPNRDHRWSSKRLMEESYKLIITGRLPGIENIICPVVHFEGAKDLWNVIKRSSRCSVKSAICFDKIIPGSHSSDLSHKEICDFYNTGYIGPFCIQNQSIVESLAKCFATYGYEFFWTLRNHHTKCHELIDFCKQADIIRKVRAILGPNLLVWLAQILPKRPHTTTSEIQEYGDKWHADGRNHLFRGVQVYMAITDTNKGNGCLQIRPRNKPDETKYMELKAGEFILMDGMIEHRGLENKSDSHRVVATGRYIPTSSECFGKTDHQIQNQDCDDPIPCMLISGVDTYNINQKISSVQDDKK